MFVIDEIYIKPYISLFLKQASISMGVRVRVLNNVFIAGVQTAIIV